MSQVEMLAAAQREYQQDNIQVETLAILQPGNEFLQEVVDQALFGERDLNFHDDLTLPLRRWLFDTFCTVCIC